MSIDVPEGGEARQYNSRIILKLLEISLRKNDFEFEEQYYLKVKGTAMGNRFAAAYNSIYCILYGRVGADGTE